MRPLHLGVELAVLDALREGAPLALREREGRALGVLRVAKVDLVVADPDGHAIGDGVESGNGAGLEPFALVRIARGIRVTLLHGLFSFPPLKS